MRKAMAVAVLIVVPATLCRAQTYAQAPAQAQKEAPAEGLVLENPPPAPPLPADWANQLVKRHEAISTERARIHIFRLRPGDDLLGSIRAYVNANHLAAAVVLSAVGSFTQASLRYANQPEAHLQTGHFEIVSITGTVEAGGEHIHLSIADGRGKMTGGHLMTGCRIYTTAEVTLLELSGARFAREPDREGSGWEELKVYPEKP
jgi:uncharacterized protein